MEISQWTENITYWTNLSAFAGMRSCPVFPCSPSTRYKRISPCHGNRTRKGSYRQQLHEAHWHKTCGALGSQQNLWFLPVPHTLQRKLPCKCALYSRKRPNGPRPGGLYLFWWALRPKDPGKTERNCGNIIIFIPRWKENRITCGQSFTSDLKLCETDIWEEITALYPWCIYYRAVHCSNFTYLWQKRNHSSLLLKTVRLI